MSHVEIQFLGSGDAFGSGGRLQSCILVTHEHGKFLIDCGASCMIGMNRYGINPNEIKMIFISHMHGDHYGGIPFLVNASQLIFKRTEPLLILGPPGMKELLTEAMEVMFPGSSRVQRKYSIEIAEFSDRRPVIEEEVKVTPYLNVHAQPDSSFALRFECGGKIIGYSSDTEWTETLCETAKDSDLFIAESYFYAKKIKGHLDYLTLMKHYEKTGAKQLILMHMSSDMLSILDRVQSEYAEDGKVIHI
jgi:ribonuclease BN (tRNA processing enzyme)